MATCFELARSQLRALAVSNVAVLADVRRHGWRVNNKNAAAERKVTEFLGEDQKFF